MQVRSNVSLMLTPWYATSKAITRTLTGAL